MCSLNVSPSSTSLMLLSLGVYFSGEFNSNWGRLIRTMRVRLDAPILQNDGGSSIGDDKEVIGGELPKFTKVLDTRVAWGPTHARMPGF